VGLFLCPALYSCGIFVLNYFNGLSTVDKKKKSLVQQDPFEGRCITFKAFPRCKLKLII